MMSKKFVFVFLAFFLVAGFAFAEETTEVTAADLSVEEPTVLPDSPFYFLKEWSRGIGNLLTFSPVKKAERQLQQANERLVEAKKLAEKTGNEQIVANAMEKYEKAVEKTKEKIEKVKEKNTERFQKLMDKFTEDSLKHSNLINRMSVKYGNAPAEVKEKIEAARERVEERLGDVLNSVDKEKVGERLEKAIGKNQNKEVNTNQLEVLKRVEQKLQNKLPEKSNATEAIKKVIEKQELRIQNRIQNAPGTNLKPTSQ